ncbi:MAG: hypothetical protein NTNFB02_17300 [Nitrospira sp.]
MQSAGKDRERGCITAYRRTLPVLIAMGFLWSPGCVRETPSSPDEAVTILLALLRDHSADTRETAAEALGKIGDQTAALPVADLLKDESPAVRRAAARALGRLGASSGNDVMPRLVGVLSDPQESVRQAGVLAIGELEPPAESLRSISKLLVSPDIEARRAAMSALVDIDVTPWLGILETVLRDDPDPRVRQRAVAVLGQMNTPAVTARVREQLARDPDPGVRAEAAYRLRMAGDEATRRALEQAARTDKNRTVRRWAEREPT